MEEIKKTQLKFDKLTCIFHSKRLFLEGNIQTSSIFQDLCLTYNRIMELDIDFSYSLNISYNNIVTDNLPNLLYGNNIIRRTNIPNFFKVLTGIDREYEKTDLKTKMYYEMIEKTIFSDLQLLLNYYAYLKNKDKSNIIWKIVRTLYSPAQTIISHYNDNKISREISRILNVFTLEECLEQIKQINIKIEAFLTSFGEDYYNKLIERNLNSLDFAIFAACKTQKAVLLTKNQEDEYKNLKIFNKNFDDIIINKLRITNDLWSLTAKEYEEFCPKTNYIDKNFENHSEISIPTDEETKTLKMRKAIVTGCFFSFLFFLKYFYKVEN